MAKKQKANDEQKAALKSTVEKLTPNDAATVLEQLQAQAKRPGAPKRYALISLDRPRRVLEADCTAAVEHRQGVLHWNGEAVPDGVVEHEAGDGFVAEVA